MPKRPNITIDTKSYILKIVTGDKSREIDFYSELDEYTNVELIDKFYLGDEFCFILKSPYVQNNPETKYVLKDNKTNFLMFSYDLIFLFRYNLKTEEFSVEDCSIPCKVTIQEQDRETFDIKWSRKQILDYLDSREVSFDIKGDTLFLRQNSYNFTKYKNVSVKSKYPLLVLFEDANYISFTKESRFSEHRSFLNDKERLGSPLFLAFSFKDDTDKKIYLSVHSSESKMRLYEFNVLSKTKIVLAEEKFIAPVEEEPNKIKEVLLRKANKNTLYLFNLKTKEKKEILNINSFPEEYHEDIDILFYLYLDFFDYFKKENSIIYTKSLQKEFINFFLVDLKRKDCFMIFSSTAENLEIFSGKSRETLAIEKYLKRIESLHRLGSSIYSSFKDYSPEFLNISISNKIQAERSHKPITTKLLKKKKRIL